MQPQQQTFHSARRVLEIAGAVAVLAVALFGLEYIRPCASGARNAGQAACAVIAILAGISAEFAMFAALEFWLGRNRKRAAPRRFRLGMTRESVIYLSAGLTALATSAAQGMCGTSASLDWLQNALSNVTMAAMSWVALLEIGCSVAPSRSCRTGSIGLLRLLLLLLITAAGAATKAVYLFGPTPKAIAVAVGGLLLGLIGVVALSESFARGAEARKNRPQVASQPDAVAEPEKPY
ncbi:MAG TPA: hypothetical protein VGM37_02710 [Armatimonadota bacterium]|jgi:hypothetical protein